jgi:CheY-like chemotaxis protein
MKKIILVVEDTLEEIERAKAALGSEETMVVVASNLQDALRIVQTLGSKLSGVVTDLHIPESVKKTDASKPQGLAVVTEALKAGLPVAVCSDIDHHDADYLKRVIAHLGNVPFVMDRKDWMKARNLLGENV